MRLLPPAIHGFSLVEMLVALALLAIAAFLIVPKFLSVQSQAETATMNQAISQLNNTYSQWVSTGGTINPTNWNNFWGGMSGNPAWDLGSTSMVIGYLCETGYSSPQPFSNWAGSSNPLFPYNIAGNTPYDPPNSTRATNATNNTVEYDNSYWEQYAASNPSYSFTPYNSSIISDSYGPNGSWTISFNLPAMFPPNPEAWLYGPGVYPLLTSSAPDGFYVPSDNGYVYYKAGNMAYIVYSAPFGAEHHAVWRG